MARPALTPSPLERGGAMAFASQLIHQLAQRRYALGLSQLDVDARIGAPDGQVAKWESGYRKPTAYNLFCWAQALNCTVSIQVIHE